jgi:hypothetical protein
MPKQEVDTSYPPISPSEFIAEIQVMEEILQPYDLTGVQLSDTELDDNKIKILTGRPLHSHWKYNQLKREQHKEFEELPTLSKVQN